MGGLFHFFVVHFETVYECMVQAWCDNILQYFISTVISLLQKMETKDLIHMVSVHLFNAEKHYKNAILLGP